MAEADELITWLGFKFKPDAKKNIEDAKRSIDMIKDGVKKIGALFLGASGAISYFTNDVMKGAQEMSDLSKKMGISTDTLQKWKYVAEASGQSFDSLVGDLQNFKKTGQDALTLSGRLAGMSSQVALQFKDYLGLSDDMFNVLRQGPEEIKKLMGEAYIIPKESIEQTAKFNKQLNAAKNTLIAMKNEIFMAVSPTLVDLTNKFKDWMKVNKEWITSKLVNVIEGVGLGFKRFVDIAGKTVDYLIKIGKSLHLISEDSPEVESVANVITGALLLWSGSKVLSGLGEALTLLKGIIGLFTADIAVGATLKSMALGFSALALSITELVVAWKTLKEIGGVLFDFVEKGVDKSLKEYEETAKKQGKGDWTDLGNKDIGYGKMMAIGYGEMLGNSPLADFLISMFGSGGWKEKLSSFKNLIPRWMTRDYANEFNIPFSDIKTGTTNTTNSGNTMIMNFTSPEQAIPIIDKYTGGVPFTTVEPGSFGGNFQP